MQQVFVQLRDKVQPPKVAARPPRSICVLHHVQQGRSATAGPPHYLLALHLLESCFCRHMHCLVKAAKSGCYWPPRYWQMMLHPVGGRQQPDAGIQHILELDQQLVEGWRHPTYTQKKHPSYLSARKW
jgi:hypothetical protein